MATTDQTLSCVECGVQFEFSVGEQKFFAEKGYTPPKRCKGCREKRKENRAPRDRR